MEHNRENFGALLKGIIGNLKSIIGSGLLPGHLNSNEWQLAEPMQRVTKEFSAKGAMVLQIIPFLEILKMELDSNQSSESEATDKLRGIVTTKDKMLS